MCRFRLVLVLWLVSSLLWLVGCRTDGAVQAALHGTLANLQREIQEAQRAGQLDRDSVEALAQAVAGREVRSAKGEPAVRRLRTVRACAKPLFHVLEDRSQRSDDAGAEAALILLETQRLPADRAVSDWAESSSGAWRAVAARASVAPKYARLRRGFFRDPDERVRRAALGAALVSRSPGDLAELLEAARLDPDPLSRSLATRATGAIGGTDAVLRLNDRWTRADDDGRMVLIEAWSMPASFQAGGERELVRVAETATGAVKIAAAHSLYVHSTEFKELGAQVLAGAIQDNTRRERQLAIQLAPVEHAELKQAIVKASKDSDPYIQVMAHAKLVTLAEQRQASLVALRKLAKAKGNQAIQARAALAATGDESVLGALTEQLKSKSAEHRKLAARGLLRLGRYPELASALGDESPDVRTQVACNVLALGH